MQGKEEIYAVPGCRMRNYRDISPEEAALVEACICRRITAAGALYNAVLFAAAVFGAAAAFTGFFYPAASLLLIPCAAAFILCAYRSAQDRGVKRVISSGTYHVIDARAYEVLPGFASDTMMHVRVRDMEGRYLWEPLRMERTAAVRARKDEGEPFLLVKYYYHGKSRFECVPADRKLAIYGEPGIYRRKRRKTGPGIPGYAMQGRDSKADQGRLEKALRNAIPLNRGITVYGAVSDAVPAPGTTGRTPAQAGACLHAQEGLPWSGP